MDNACNNRTNVSDIVDYLAAGALGAVLALNPEAIPVITTAGAGGGSMALSRYYDNLTNAQCFEDSILTYYENLNQVCPAVSRQQAKKDCSKFFD